MFWLESRQSGSSPLLHRTLGKINYKLPVFNLHTLDFHVTGTAIHYTLTLLNDFPRPNSKDWGMRGSARGWAQPRLTQLQQLLQSKSREELGLAGGVSAPFPTVPGAVQNPQAPEPRWPGSGFHIQGRSCGGSLELSSLRPHPGAVGAHHKYPAHHPWEDGRMTVSTAWHRGRPVSPSHYPTATAADEGTRSVDPAPEPLDRLRGCPVFFIRWKGERCPVPAPPDTQAPGGWWPHLSHQQSPSPPGPGDLMFSPSP